MTSQMIYENRMSGSHGCTAAVRSGGIVRIRDTAPKERRISILDILRIITLTGVVMTAVLCDLQSGRIPNGVIAAGLGFGLCDQLFSNGPVGIILFLGGAGLPVFLPGILYYFRMIGAGDIKLLCVAGGFLGPAGGFACIVLSVFLGAAISLFLMYRNRSLSARLFYFLDYMYRYLEYGEWSPYMQHVGEHAKFCFSVPVLISVIYCLCTV